MEFFDNKLCISFRELVDGGIMTVPNYKYMASSGRIKVARRGGGAKGNGALIVIDSLPTSYKEKSRGEISWWQCRAFAWLDNIELRA